MRQGWLVVASLSLVACSSQDSSGFDAGKPDASGSDAGADTPSVPDSGQESGVPSLLDGMAEAGRVISHLSGVVFAPEGTIPIPGAVVYLSSTAPAALPNGLYCDHCVQLTQGTPYAITAADGTFTLGAKTPGLQYIVTQKGQFRRYRTLSVPSSGVTNVPAEDTTLPGTTSLPGDKVPNIAVIQGDYDAVENSLELLGLVPKPGVFDILTSSAVLSDAAQLAQYNFVFVPCMSDTTWIMGNTAMQTNVRNFVAGGGLVYNSDWAYDFTTATWPEVINLVGETSQNCSACGNEYDVKSATILSKELRAWAVNTDALGTETPSLVQNWTKVDTVSSYSTTDENGKPITATPTPLVENDIVKAKGDHVNTLSFPWGCGKAFFTTYHTETTADGGLGTSGTLNAQEKLLMILVLQASVCLSAPGTGVVTIK